LKANAARARAEADKFLAEVTEQRGGNALGLAETAARTAAAIDAALSSKMAALELEAVVAERALVALTDAAEAAIAVLRAYDDRRASSEPSPPSVEELQGAIDTLRAAQTSVPPTTVAPLPLEPPVLTFTACTMSELDTSGGTGGGLGTIFAPPAALLLSAVVSPPPIAVIPGGRLRLTVRINEASFSMRPRAERAAVVATLLPRVFISALLASDGGALLGSQFAPLADDSGISVILSVPESAPVGTHVFITKICVSGQPLVVLRSAAMSPSSSSAATTGHDGHKYPIRVRVVEHLSVPITTQTRLCACALPALLSGDSQRIFDAVKVRRGLVWVFAVYVVLFAMATDP
jgi:hypothetical protein